jgi:hypothetical protein
MALPLPTSMSCHPGFGKRCLSAIVLDHREDLDRILSDRIGVDSTIVSRFRDYSSLTWFECLAQLTVPRVNRPAPEAEYVHMTMFDFGH